MLFLLLKVNIEQKTIETNKGEKEPEQKMAIINEKE